jgi:ATP-dependent protease ClpP protease subunit
MKLLYRNQKNAEAVAQYWNKPLNKPDWYSVKNLDADEAELFIYDYVGWPYNDAGELVRMLSDIKNTPILARINSPGGDVWDGMAILNAFTNHPGGVRVRIESLAASIASVLAMGGKTIEAYSNTMMMIHNSWVFVAGNKEELIETSELLGQIDENIVGAYTVKTKLGKKEVRETMVGPKGNGTYMNAKTMKEKGFIDTILEAGKPAKAEFDLSMFADAPEDIANIKDIYYEPTIRDAEKALRDVGFRQNTAKGMLAGSKQIIADKEEIEVLKTALSDSEARAVLQELTLHFRG